MAKKIALIHKETGIKRAGYYGFSWTSLFFGPLPALFRGDLVIFLLYEFGDLIVQAITSCASHNALSEKAPIPLIILAVFEVIWAFKYNNYYTCNLVERGYSMTGSPDEIIKAKIALNMSIHVRPDSF